MTLREFLSAFDFDYQIILNDNKYEAAHRTRLIDDGDLDKTDFDQPLVALIDEQGANFGNIEGDRFRMDESLAANIIDRMDIYIQDGVVAEFVDVVENHGIDSSDLDLSALVDTVRRLEGNKAEVDYELAAAILSPETIEEVKT